MDTLDAFDLAPGFRATATACGLKESGSLDLALISSERDCGAAGVFTSNRVKAAPVLYDQAVLARGAERIRAVLVNAGCANACTGEPGLEDTRASASLTARALGCSADQVLVLSTGVIGRRLDMSKIERGIEALASPAARADAREAARAILTTDTKTKVASADADLAGGRIALRGFAKGSGMIHPDMATMLAVITTDIPIGPRSLAESLRRAVAKSFNRISVDGDMSTNDTVLLLASGRSGVAVGPGDRPAFENALTAVCVSLAKQIARDGEGATRLVEIEVAGAADETQAHAVADAIARSPLVRTALHGGDPNWGRILAAAGACGVAIDERRLALSFGAAPNEVKVVSRGLRASYDERLASESLRGDPIFMRLDLGTGHASATVWTCDLSAEYVAINAHYTT